MSDRSNKRRCQESFILRLGLREVSQRNAIVSPISSPNHVPRPSSKWEGSSRGLLRRVPWHRTRMPGRLPEECFFADVHSKGSPRVLTDGSRVRPAVIRRLSETLATVREFAAAERVGEEADVAKIRARGLEARKRTQMVSAVCCVSRCSGSSRWFKDLTGRNVRGPGTSPSRQEDDPERFSLGTGCRWRAPMTTAKTAWKGLGCWELTPGAL